jgi:hypothetical protein
MRYRRIVARRWCLGTAMGAMGVACAPRICAAEPEPDHERGQLARILRAYGDRTHYADRTVGRATVVSAPVTFESRTAFVRPDRLYFESRATLKRETRTVFLARGDRYMQWNRSKGWQPLSRLRHVTEAAFGATVFFGGAGWWVMSLLVNPEALMRPGFRDLLLARTSLSSAGVSTDPDVVEGRVDEWEIAAQCQTGGTTIARIVTNRMQPSVRAACSVSEASVSSTRTLRQRLAESRSFHSGNESCVEHTRRVLAEDGTSTQGSPNGARGLQRRTAHCFIGVVGPDGQLG